MLAGRPPQPQLVDGSAVLGFQHVDAHDVRPGAGDGLSGTRQCTRLVGKRDPQSDPHVVITRLAGYRQVSGMSLIRVVTALAVHLALWIDECQQSVRRERRSFGGD